MNLAATGDTRISAHRTLGMECGKLNRTYPIHSNSTKAFLQKANSMYIYIYIYLGHEFLIALTILLTGKCWGHARGHAPNWRWCCRQFRSPRVPDKLRNPPVEIQISTATESCWSSFFVQASDVRSTRAHSFHGWHYPVHPRRGWLGLLPMACKKLRTHWGGIWLTNHRYNMVQPHLKVVHTSRLDPEMVDARRPNLPT